MKITLLLMTLPLLCFLLRNRLLRFYLHVFVQASSRAKCPCCGVRAKHQLQWSTLLQKLVHVCARCKAAWTEQPLVAAQSWAVPMTITDGEDTLDRDGVRSTTTQHAQREPVVTKNFKPAQGTAPVVVRISGS